ncbi:hypothetical protein T492DRAFT_460657 [Pavlovales sp. CCMP2436]|nr:hypothetical protein T492DRAFT_460657 [Pavlovales sp. CCMP2436]
MSHPCVTASVTPLCHTLNHCMFHTLYHTPASHPCVTAQYETPPYLPVTAPSPLRTPPLSQLRLVGFGLDRSQQAGRRALPLLGRGGHFFKKKLSMFFCCTRPYSPPPSTLVVLVPIPLPLPLLLYSSLFPSPFHSCCTRPYSPPPSTLVVLVPIPLPLPLLLYSSLFPSPFHSWRRGFLILYPSPNYSI